MTALRFTICHFHATKKLAERFNLTTDGHRFTQIKDQDFDANCANFREFVPVQKVQRKGAKEQRRNRISNHRWTQIDTDKRGETDANCANFHEFIPGGLGDYTNEDGLLSHAPGPWRDAPPLMVNAQD
jgi:hypothetical protein